MSIRDNRVHFSWFKHKEFLKIYRVLKSLGRAEKILVELRMPP